MGGAGAVTYVWTTRKFKNSAFTFNEGYSNEGQHNVTKVFLMYHLKLCFSRDFSQKYRINQNETFISRNY